MEKVLLFSEMDLSEEERAMQAQVMETLNNQKEVLKQSVKKWNSEKEANEEYIAQMRANKEARKKEMEEMERMKAQLLEAEEEEEQKAEHMPGVDIPAEPKKTEVVVKEDFKSKEQVTSSRCLANSKLLCKAEMEEALAERVRPLTLEGMDSEQLKERMQEYWKAFTSIKQEKAGLAVRWGPVKALLSTNLFAGLRSRTMRSRRLKKPFPRSFLPSRRRRVLTWRG